MVMTETAPLCPSCHKPVERIYTSRTVHIVWKDGRWVEEQVDHYFTACCCNCYEELSEEELDRLGVPNDIR
jgi:hypothetical protein